MTATVRLPEAQPAEWWSPTAYNTLRRCPLALAYDWDHTLHAQLRRPSTFSAVGEISHRLTEEVWKAHYNEVPLDQLKPALSDRWDQLAAEQHERLTLAWAPATPPLPAEWPFYAKSKSRTIVRLLRDAEAYRGQSSTTPQPPALIEGWLTDATIQLRGRPDRVQWKDGTYRVVDLKAGPHVAAISEDHLQQLLLYAHLVAVNTGHQPSEVAVVNAIGIALSHATTPEEIHAAVAEFRDRSTRFNDHLGSPQALVEQATPSKDACRRCAYRGVCPAFQSHAASTWEARTLEGTVTAVPSQRTFAMTLTTPHDLAGTNITIVMDDPRPVAVGDFVACVDVFPEGTPVRLEWNSFLIRNGLEATA